MSRDTRPRRRQELLDPSETTDAQTAPGADAADTWRSAWQVSPSRLRHRGTEPDGQRFLFDLPDLTDRNEEEPERWDGLS